MTSPLPLRSIEAFISVARAASLAAAATSLNITVPAVSRRIAILERHLGMRLFQRLPRGVALTDAGAAYIAEVAPAWDQLLKASAAAKASARARPLKISVMPSFAVNWLMPRLVRDAMSVELETDGDVVDLRMRPDLDAAIRLGRGPWPGLVCLRFLPVEAYPVASPTYAPRPRTPHDLSKHVLIGSNHQPDFWPEWSRLSGAAFSRERYRSFDNLQLVYEAAIAGLGIAIGLDPIVRRYLDSGRLVRLWPETVTLSRSFHLVHRQDRVVDRSYGKFRDWLLAQAA
ncbi:MAG: LysR family transcriptional regulator [Alphaproteobacteria bacterium]|nr:LysR family transcriptional regulator [Alphaproteobacteria bacterium]MCW5740784.1 LysR family transcriptional regulator [Alphaproteobacteria bacterium]